MVTSVVSYSPLSVLSVETPRRAPGARHRPRGRRGCGARDRGAERLTSGRDEACDGYPRKRRTPVDGLTVHKGRTRPECARMKTPVRLRSKWRAKPTRSDGNSQDLICVSLTS